MGFQVVRVAMLATITAMIGCTEEEESTSELAVTMAALSAGGWQDGQSFGFDFEVPVPLESLVARYETYVFEREAEQPLETFEGRIDVAAPRGSRTIAVSLPRSFDGISIRVVLSLTTIAGQPISVNRILPAGFAVALTQRPAPTARATPDTPVEDVSDLKDTSKE